jgi:hypothetical protein
MIVGMDCTQRTWLWYHESGKDVEPQTNELGLYSVENDIWNAKRLPTIIISNPSIVSTIFRSQNNLCHKNSLDVYGL